MKFQPTSTVARYTIYGALFGFIFPIAATIIDIMVQGLPLHPFSALFVQVTQPLHWIIDCAPVVLGGAGALIGVRQRAMEQLNHDLTQSVKVQTAELARANESLRARATQLELIMHIIRRVSAILDRQELVSSVVELIRSTLEYYHVHVYLFDEERQRLVISAGSGEAGEKMLRDGHYLPLGKGLVGRAAESNLAVVVPDVGKNKQWAPNPLLPETRAEVAVPIHRGDRVLGVLDVQHDRVGGLGQEDAEVLQTIADQIAVALENSQLYAQVQQRVERERRLNTITQKIQDTANMDDALQVAVRELGWALNGSPTSARILAAERPSEGNAA